MDVSGLFSTWLWLVINLLLGLLVIMTVFKLLQVLFKLNNVLDKVRAYIRRQS